MNLQAQGTRRGQSGRHAESLKRNDRRPSHERKHQPVGPSLEVGNPRDDPGHGLAREVVQRILVLNFLAQRRLFRPRPGQPLLPKTTKESWATVADHQGAPAIGQQLGQGRARDPRHGGIEGRSPKGQDDVKPHRAKRVGKRSQGGFRVRASGGGNDYRKVNGYGVDNPSEGGKVAVLIAFSTQAPVGVPENFPVTEADVILPLLPMTTLTIAKPGTLNWL